MKTITINHNGTDYELEIDYEMPDPGVAATEGDPGQPALQGEYEIVAINRFNTKLAGSVYHALAYIFQRDHDQEIREALGLDRHSAI